MLVLHVALSCVLLALRFSVAASQQTSYIDFRPGTLNLILTAPHGGTEKPSTIRDRTAGCYDAVTKKCSYRHDCTPDYNRCPVTTVLDTNTYQAAEKIRNYIYKLTGKYPYFIASKLQRIKLDPNREINEATFGEPIAVSNYEYYHGMIAESKAQIDRTGLYNSALVIDVHGQSHSHNITELGYNLTAKELDSGSYSLQRTSTVRYAANKLGNSNAIITGAVSLGHFFEQASIKSMPSPANPKINGRSYFDGGYTVETHSSQEHDAIQIEFSRTVRLGDATDFDQYMQSVAIALTSFLQIHYGEKTAP